MIDWLRALAPYHDYGWFIALLGWCAAAVIARRTLRDQPDWSWLPWAAWPGAIAALVELVSFAWPIEFLRGRAGLMPEDMLLGALAAFTVAGWIFILPAGRMLRVAAVVVVISAAGARFVWPAVGSAAIAGAGLLVAIALAVSPAISRRARFALIASVMGLWLGSSGPLASFGLQPRGVIALGEWSPVWSSAQAIVALVVFVGVISPWFVEGKLRREWRPFLAGCGLWLLVGLGLAEVMSAGARSQFEAQAIGRTRMAASLMDKAALTELLDREFQLAEVFARPRPSDGSLLWQSRAPRLATRAGVEVQKQLAVIARAGSNRGFFAHIQTPRAGWIVRIHPQGYSNNPLNQEKLSDRVSLAQEVAEDLLDWADRRARFLPLILEMTGRANSFVQARAPLLNSDNRMVGWLLIEFPRSQWVAAQVESRFQTFAIVGLGLGLAILSAIQRVRTDERETARADATAAAQADRLKTAFLAKVSHELRTPIQSVLGYGDMLRRTIHEPLARRWLAALREHGGLMLRLVNDLLDLSAIQAGAFRLIPKPNPLGELVQQTVESLRPRAEAKGLALTIGIGADVPAWVAVDGERVRQVILNLVGNAIKFTDHGRVEVMLKAGPRTDEVVLIVRDTGPGIPAEGLGKLFQPFERLEGTAEKEGTGLGLALTAGICRGMGGNVIAESAAGAGTIFRASFKAPPCVPAVRADSSGALPPLTGRHVLVVDDNVLVRELFVASLQEAGARCTAAEDGEQAIAAVEQENFDAVVLDLSMPRLDGLGAARRLRATGRAVRIIGVSAHAGESEREEALAAGMDAFLVKPVSLDVLLSTIIAEPEGERPPVDNIAKLIERLREQFRGLAAEEGAGIAEAIASRDFTTACVRAHHLMNSAAVVRDDRLFEACVQAETAARNHDDAALKVAWAACVVALAPWVTAPPATGTSQIIFVRSTTISPKTH